MFPLLSPLIRPPITRGLLDSTLTLKSRINTYLESDGLPVPEASSRRATPPPIKPHSDPPKNMKRLVNQKLCDFKIKGALQTSSGNSSFVHPNEESLNTFQKKHPQAPDDLKLPHPPDANTTPICFSTIHIHAAISSFPHGSGAGPDSLRPQHLKDNISITAGDAGTSLLISLWN